MADQSLAVVRPLSEDMAVGRTPLGHVPVNTGSGLEGADLSRETVSWRPNMGSPDQIINRAKATADARGIDMVRNDGLAHGVTSIHKDSIVGSHFRLNASPVLSVLQAKDKRFDEVWLKEFQEVVEARFDLIAESEGNWLDASRMNTLTGMTRLAVTGSVLRGEVLATGEWIRNQPRRPCYTAIQMISPDRLSNPQNTMDTRYLKRGVVKDIRGRPVGYWIRSGHPSEHYDNLSYEWKLVPAETRFGRKQVIHIIDQMEPDQSRGVAAMVSVLKKMRMTKQFSEIALQNMVVQASYAAAIESELPPEVVTAMMGGVGGEGGYTGAVKQYMDMLAAYIGGTNNISVDGVKIPHLFPGTKLNVMQLGQPGGIGMAFEESMHRHIAAGLDTSYEEFSKDFSKLSYSGLKGAFASTERHMKAKKKQIADRFAGNCYSLYLEEDIQDRNVPLPHGISPLFFYEPLMKEALCKSNWIGAGKGQIDELKETQAAIMRVQSGLSTYEIEIARFGNDWREVFAQKAREAGIIADYGLVLTVGAQKPTLGAASVSGEDPTDNPNDDALGSNIDPEEDEDL